MQKTPKFDKQFFGEFWQLTKPFWASEQKWRAMLLLALATLCVFAEVRATVAINLFYKDLFDALQNFNKSALPSLVLTFSIAVGVLILAFGYRSYFSGLLSIRWREWLTKHYLSAWLHNHTYYNLQILNKKIDNPDQRIADDIARFTSTTVNLFTDLLRSVLTLVTFSFILWQISASFQIPIGSNSSITIYGYLFWCALIYAIIGTWLTNTLGSSLANFDYQQERNNANFRFGLMRVRETSEQIALQKGHITERHILNKTFKPIVDNFLDIIRLQKNLLFFSNGYKYLSYIVGIVIGLPLFFSQKIHLGGLMQVTGAFDNVVVALSLFVSSFILLADWRATIYRLTEFKIMMGEAANVKKDIIFTPSTHEHLSINNLDLKLPCGTKLISDLNLTIKSSEKVLITGHSGIGKSVFLRTLAGIWPHGEGEIHLPHNKQIMFLSQKPYLPLGTLRDTLLYPTQNKIEDQKLESILAFCGLEKLIPKLMVTQNWSHELSLGEQQLVSFARLFLQKPDWIFLDEATSALDELNEIKIYKHLVTLLPDATIVSVGHRSSLNQFHGRKVELTDFHQNHIYN